jgi:hypothetical protein
MPLIPLCYLLVVELLADTEDQDEEEEQVTEGGRRPETVPAPAEIYKKNASLPLPASAWLLA